MEVEFAKELTYSSKSNQEISRSRNVKAAKAYDPEKSNNGSFQAPGHVANSYI
jgi:hypothetical protein